MPTYKADADDPPEAIKHDLYELKDYVWNWSDALDKDGDVIASDGQASVWDLPEGIEIGDGVTEFQTVAGPVVAPSPDLFDGNRKTRAWFFMSTTGYKRIRNSVRGTAGRVYSRSLDLDVLER